MHVNLIAWLSLQIEFHACGKWCHFLRIFVCHDCHSSIVEAGRLVTSNYTSGMHSAFNQFVKILSLVSIYYTKIMYLLRIFFTYNTNNICKKR